MAFLDVQNIEKTLHTKDGDTQALKGVSFSVDKGEIFGVIGLSGAC